MVQSFCISVCFMGIIKSLYYRGGYGRINVQYMIFHNISNPWVPDTKKKFAAEGTVWKYRAAMPFFPYLSWYGFSFIKPIGGMEIWKQKMKKAELRSLASW